MTVKIGSCFAGIGGWELGLERAIPNSRTIWQVEENAFCQGILKKHWPDAIIYDDVRTVGAHNLEPIDLLCAGFPCQDLSRAGKQRGIHDGEKSNLYWELHRIIGELRPRIICLENVANIIRLGGADVIGSLAAIGYDCEWTVIRSGSDFGAPHRRSRWFCVGYTRSVLDNRRTFTDSDRNRLGAPHTIPTGRPPVDAHAAEGHTTNSDSLNKLRAQRRGLLEAFNNVPPHIRGEGCTVGRRDTGSGYWRKISPPSAVCRVDDGIPAGMDSAQHNRIRKERLKALGNAIVPQASEWVGRQIVQSGLIDDLID